MKLLRTIALLAFSILIVHGEAATVYWNTISPYVVRAGGLDGDDHRWMGALVCDLGNFTGMNVANFEIEMSDDYSIVTVTGDISGTSPAGTMVRYFFSGSDNASGLPFVGYFDMAWSLVSGEMATGESFVSLGHDATLPESVPEPTSGLLLLVGSVFLLTRRRS